MKKPLSQDVQDHCDQNTQLDAGQVETRPRSSAQHVLRNTARHEAQLRPGTKSNAQESYIMLQHLTQNHQNQWRNRKNTVVTYKKRPYNTIQGQKVMNSSAFNP